MTGEHSPPGGQNPGITESECRIEGRELLIGSNRWRYNVDLRLIEEQGSGGEWSVMKPRKLPRGSMLAYGRWVSMIRKEVLFL